MNHPDYAWSPDYYVRPDGVDPEPHVCHPGRRQRTGPYPGKAHIFILTSNCYQCGRVMRSHEDISWQAYFWARRYNVSIAKPPHPMSMDIGF